MDQGRIQEQGTHDELLRLEGHYFELCSAQGIVNSDPNDKSKSKTL